MKKLNLDDLTLTKTPALLIFLLGVLCWVGMGDPLYKNWRQKLEQNQLQKRLLVEKLTVISRQNIIEKEYAEISKNLSSTGSDAQEVSILENEITSLAKQTGVKVQRTKPRPIETRNETKQLLLELNCQGKMMQLADFIYRMQTSSHILRVEQMRLTMENDKRSTLRATLLVSKLLLLD